MDFAYLNTYCIDVKYSRLFQCSSVLISAVQCSVLQCFSEGQDCGINHDCLNMRPWTLDVISRSPPLQCERPGASMQCQRPGASSLHRNSSRCRNFPGPQTSPTCPMNVTTLVSPLNTYFTDWCCQGGCSTNSFLRN